MNAAVRPAVQRGAEQLASVLSAAGWTVTLVPGYPRPSIFREVYVQVGDKTGTVFASVVVGASPLGGMGRRFLVRPVIKGLQFRRVLTLATAATLTQQYARAAVDARALEGATR